MGILAGIAGKAIDTIGGIISEKVEDKDLANKLTHEMQTTLATMQHEADLAELQAARDQTAVNLESAKSSSFFVAGARPSCIWAGMAMMVFCCIVGSFAAFNPDYQGAATTISILYGAIVSPPFMLLLGARTYEKQKGVARGTHKAENEARQS